MFDENYRCGQNKNIVTLSNELFNCKDINEYVSVSETVNKIKIIKEIIDETKFIKSEQIILIHSSLIDDFKEIVKDYFKNDLEELVENNINTPSSKIRFTTPIKYRGLENKSVYLITNNLDEKSKVQNYVAVTRAMDQVKIIVWTK